MHQNAPLFAFFLPTTPICRPMQQNTTKCNIFEVFTDVACERAAHKVSGFGVAPREFMPSCECIILHRFASLSQFFGAAPTAPPPRAGASAVPALPRTDSRNTLRPRSKQPASFAMCASVASRHHFSLNTPGPHNMQTYMLGKYSEISRFQENFCLRSAWRFCSAATPGRRER